MTATGHDVEYATALELARWAVDTTARLSLGDIGRKSNPADLVTDADTAIERHVRAVVAERFPDHAFVGEEYGGSARPGVPTWYLDPVDGTTNLANGMPWSSFSLALAIDDRPLLAVVADPWRHQIFDARAGGGARLDGQVLQVRADTALAGGIVSTELNGHRPWPGMPDFCDGLSRRYCTVRVMGSGTLTLAGVAAGRSAGAVVGGFGAEDHLAAALIAHEAGAVVLDESGIPTLFPDSGGMLIAAPAVADELFELWSASVSAAVGLSPRGAGTP
jgi:myo-inositol-1(or 4)-monophosphatase